MKQTKADILAKLNQVAKPADDWQREAQYRRDNQHWLPHAQAVALRVLRTLRTQSKTQKQLAEAMGVSPQQVNKWVKGKENLTLDTIGKLETALNISLIEVPQKQSSRQEVVKQISMTIEKTSLQSPKIPFTYTDNKKVVRLSYAPSPILHNRSVKYA